MLVVPSRWQEPFGLIGTEAFNKCKPVVAFDVGGISEWLSNGENGISVAEGDVSGLARGIDYLIEHPDEAEAMGREGYDMLDREYSVEAFYGKFLNIMGELNV